MKKYIFTLIALSVMLVPTLAFAQEDTTEVELVSTQTEQEEETPNEEVADPTKPLYFFTTVLEEIQIFFTFDDDKKIEKRLEFAEKRIAEMALMAQEGNEAELEKIRTRYERQIAQALKIANKHAEKADEKAFKIEEQRAKHLETLERVYEQVPEEAKPSIEKVIDKTEVRYETDKTERQALKKANKGNSQNSNKGGDDTVEEVEE